MTLHPNSRVGEKAIGPQMLVGHFGSNRRDSFLRSASVWIWSVVTVLPSSSSRGKPRAPLRCRSSFSWFSSLSTESCVWTLFLGAGRAPPRPLLEGEDLRAEGEGEARKRGWRWTREKRESSQGESSIKR